jgi:hypothetical protein
MECASYLSHPLLSTSLTNFWIPETLSPLSLLSCYRTMDKVDATMTSINEQREIANEISDLISNPVNIGVDIDEVRKSRREELVLMAFRGANTRRICRMISRHSWRSSSRTISTSDSWARIMCRCTLQRVRAALIRGTKWQQKNPRMRS